MGNSYIKQFVTEIKIDRGCAICGYRKLSNALHLHHIIGEKEGSVSNLYWKGGIHTATQEIMKCVVLCSNCHAEVHAGIHKEIDLIDKRITMEDTGVEEEFEAFKRKKIALRLLRV